MAGSVGMVGRTGGSSLRIAQKDPWWLRWLLLGFALTFLTLFLALPLAVVGVEALRKGAKLWVAAVTEPEAKSAIRLTLITAALAVPLNTFFGVAAAWAITRFSFRGKAFLVSLIDLPFAISPVVAGLMLVLVFGANGWLGPWLQDREWRVIFAMPGIVLATMVVTFPFVAREVIPVLEASGRDEEEAAVTLGAGGWRVFWQVTLPKMRWGLFYGIILCNARAMGEFGAVSVVSGHIRGETNTIPLHVEVLYNEYQSQASFAVASLLVLVALVTLVLKRLVELRAARDN